jgi:ABC-type transporter Mla MlaB component
LLDYQFKPGELSLSGRLKVQYLDILKEALSQAQGSEDSLRVDISQVREVDLAGLQLLTAWLRQHGGAPEVRLTGLPGAVERALDLAGLKSHVAPYLE